MTSPDQPASVAADPSSELTANFSETARALFAAGTVDATLRQIVGSAVSTIDGCDYAGIVVVEGSDVSTPVHTDPVVVAVDSLQREAGEGPFFDIISQGDGTLYVGDLADDARWALVGPQAADLGVRSVLAIHLHANGTLGVLNLYARYPQAFGAVDRAKALILGVLAGLAFALARGHDDGERRHEDEERRVGNLQTALITREVIGQAQGILMEREHLAADEAFDILRRASQHLNVKLREVAQTLVETGERPATGPPAVSDTARS